MNSHSHIFAVMFLDYQLRCHTPWKLSEGIQVLALALYSYPLGDNAVTSGTWLDTLAIRSNSSSLKITLDNAYIIVRHQSK